MTPDGDTDSAAIVLDSSAGRRGRLRILLEKLGEESRSEAVRGAGVSLGLKVAMSALNLVMLTLIARSMSGHEFGTFAFWYNGAVFLAVAAGLGQEKLILRNWSEYRTAESWSLARGALRFGTAVSIAGALTIAGGILLAGMITGQDRTLTIAASLFLVVQTLFFFSAHATRAVAGIVPAGIHESSWRLVVIAVLVASLVGAREVTTAEFFWIAAGGMGLGLVAQTLSVLRHRPVASRAAPSLLMPRAWSLRSLKMAIGGNLEAATQYLEVIAVGLVLEPKAAGLYFVASRLANIFLMISSGLDSYTTRQVPRLFFAGGAAALAPVLRRLAVITTLPVVAGLALIVLLGQPILGLFGAAFVPAYPVLVALSAGTAVMAMAGPAMPVLVLTGHEGTYSGLLGLTLALRLGLVVALALAAGPLGAALGSAAATIAGTVALNLACRIRAGIDPSIVSVLGRPAGPVR